jgi:hypothetical protein
MDIILCYAAYSLFASYFGKYAVRNLNDEAVAGSNVKERSLTLRLPYDKNFFFGERKRRILQ